MKDYEVFRNCYQINKFERNKFKEMVVRVSDIITYPSRLYCSRTYPCLPKKGNTLYHYNQPPTNKNLHKISSKGDLETRVQRQEIKLQKAQEKIEKEKQIQQAFKRDSNKKKVK